MPQSARAIVGLASDILRLVVSFLRSSRAIRAENLILRKQLARYIERGIKPRRVDCATRVSLALFTRLFDWRDTVVNVRPATIVRWHRLGWRIFWRLKCRAGRPPIPAALRSLICQMAAANPLWGEERIANELLVKLGIRVSPRTVGKYMPKRPPGQPRRDQRWSTFLKNHAEAILACDFFVAITATFRMLYVFVVIEHSTRRLAHVNVTANPNADWTLQQLREDPATRVSLAVLARLCNWREALIVLRPETLIRWHRAGWRLLWHYKSQTGRPPIPAELRALIRRMATENPLWGEERIANELLLKLGLQVSPRTVSKYMPKRPPGRPRGDQRWSTFLRNHARGIVACDFFVSVTATFRLLYVLVLIEHGSRRLLHLNMTQHPTAAWTLQQLREVIGCGDGYRYLLHDRDSIFARHLDESVRALGLSVLKSPPRCPKANAICERVIGTIRRECLDWLIPMSERHLRSMLKSWVEHYNRGRPHSSLGPGVPDPPREIAVIRNTESRHRLAAGSLVLARSVLGGLHHEYLLAPAIA